MLFPLPPQGLPGLPLLPGLSCSIRETSRTPKLEPALVTLTILHIGPAADLSCTYCTRPEDSTAGTQSYLS